MELLDLWVWAFIHNNCGVVMRAGFEGTGVCGAQVGRVLTIQSRATEREKYDRTFDAMQSANTWDRSFFKSNFGEWI
jgi:hypothetical protein